MSVGDSRVMDIAVRLLPQPLSPTIATRSPSETRSDTERTGVRIFPSRVKRIRRLLISSSGLLTVVSKR